MSRMSQVERRELILTRLRELGRVENVGLSEEFGVTEMTIRRDIERLQGEGLVVRVYGGAVLSAARTFDPPFDVRVTTNVEAKQRITRKAVEFVPNGANVALDYGTKMLFLSRHLRRHSGATIAPASIRCANELAANPAIRQILPGGQLKPGELSVYGSMAEEFYRTHHWDVSFLSPAGIDAEKGVTDFGEPEARLKEALLVNTDRAIVLAEASQIGLVTFSPVCDIEHINVLVTDLHPGAPEGLELQRRGIEVVYA